MQDKGDTEMQYSSYSSSRSAYKSLPTSPVRPPPKNERSTSAEPALSTTETKNLPDTQELPYVKLNSDFARRIIWSNNPGDLDLAGAFSKDTPNLASDFKVEGLRLILVDRSGDEYILKDTKDNYYLWDMWDGHLLKIPDEYTQGPELQAVEEVVENILGEMYWIRQEAEKVYRDRDM